MRLAAAKKEGFSRGQLCLWTLLQDSTLMWGSGVGHLKLVQFHDSEKASVGFYSEMVIL